MLFCSVTALKTVVKLVEEKQEERAEDFKLQREWTGKILHESLHSDSMSHCIVAEHITRTVCLSRK